MTFKNWPKRTLEIKLTVVKIIIQISENKLISICLQTGQKSESQTQRNDPESGRKGQNKWNYAKTTLKHGGQRKNILVFEVLGWENTETAEEVSIQVIRTTKISELLK